MSAAAAFWDIRGDPSFSAGDRDRVVAELKRRDALRNRKRESETERNRPTFVVRKGLDGDKLSSWADDSVRHVPITVKDGWHSIPNGVKARSLIGLLVELGYLDEDIREDIRYVPVNEAKTGSDSESESGSCVSGDDDDDDDGDGPYKKGPSGGGDVVDRYAPAPDAKKLRKKDQISEADLILDAKPMAEGHFGQVFKGQLKRNGELVAVAVKVCKAKYANLQAKASSDFVNELAILRTLTEHENVVSFFGAQLDADGAPMRLVLQFCSGGSLLSAIEGKLWKEWRVGTKVRLLTGVARGLEHLHAGGIIHRDLAARNVLLEVAATGERIAKVTDFGMARAVDDAGTGSHTVNPIGPRFWMAPEQFHKLQYSAASDAYAFGVVAYELFTRKQPWAGVHPDDAVGHVLAGTQLQFGKCDIPAELRGLIAVDCWAMDPKDRPSLREVRIECEKIAAKLK